VAAIHPDGTGSRAESLLDQLAGGDRVAKIGTGPEYAAQVADLCQRLMTKSKGSVVVGGEGPEDRLAAAVIVPVAVVRDGGGEVDESEVVGPEVGVGGE